MTLTDIIPKLANHLGRLPLGDLAELRRQQVKGPGAPAFWRLASQYGFLHQPVEPWVAITKIMAILTPRAAQGDAGSLHSRSHPLGRALCDGGQSGWVSGANAMPVFSEARLARLIALPFNRRAEGLERAARMIANKRDKNIGINCFDIANLLLSDDPSHIQKLSQAYYGRLDGATNPKGN
ncbi:hypothetical protein [Thalassospira xiamenensis]|uniref:CRISPR system Cascade subunit CasB n=1 Tax=Thalassospira xiamenensis TaxID=220697 RepID=A0A285TY63_9PROT|nr:hypothetical protein [Thalassospira xiamenensis]SOC30913.1 CRISPR system Cascade subunit CasB [Thalassospira xiamenensis]